MNKKSHIFTAKNLIFSLFIISLCGIAFFIVHAAYGQCTTCKPNTPNDPPSVRYTTPVAVSSETASKIISSIPTEVKDSKGNVIYKVDSDSDANSLAATLYTQAAAEIAANNNGAFARGASGDGTAAANRALLLATVAIQNAKMEEFKSNPTSWEYVAAQSTRDEAVNFIAAEDRALSSGSTVIYTTNERGEERAWNITQANTAFQFERTPDSSKMNVGLTTNDFTQSMLEMAAWTIQNDRNLGISGTAVETRDAYGYISKAGVAGAYHSELAGMSTSQAEWTLRMYNDAKDHGVADVDKYQKTATQDYTSWTSTNTSIEMIYGQAARLGQLYKSDPVKYADYAQYEKFAGRTAPVAGDAVVTLPDGTRYKEMTEGNWVNITTGEAVGINKINQIYAAKYGSIAKQTKDDNGNIINPAPVGSPSTSSTPQTFNSVTKSQGGLLANKDATYDPATKTLTLTATDTKYTVIKNSDGTITLVSQKDPSSSFTLNPKSSDLAKDTINLINTDPNTLQTSTTAQTQAPNTTTGGCEGGNCNISQPPISTSGAYAFQGGDSSKYTTDLGIKIVNTVTQDGSKAMANAATDGNLGLVVSESNKAVDNIWAQTNINDPIQVLNSVGQTLVVGAQSFGQSAVAIWNNFWSFGTSDSSGNTGTPTATDGSSGFFGGGTPISTDYSVFGSGTSNLLGSSDINPSWATLPGSSDTTLSWGNLGGAISSGWDSGGLGGAISGGWGALTGGGDSGGGSYDSGGSYNGGSGAFGGGWGDLSGFTPEGW